MDQLNNNRVLLTGSNGFLGQKITDLLCIDENQTVCCTSRSANRNPNKNGYTFVPLDLLDAPSLEKLVLDFKPSHIIHTAALTSVEGCQSDPDYCKRLNIDVVSQLADLCARQDIHLTFLSTDFVFNGKQSTPYQENDRVSPCNLYGQSKIEAEHAIKQSGCRAAILRTILVYGVIADRSRSNLILWAKSKLELGEAIRVVSDQWRMPTWVDDLAKITLKVLEKQAEGLFHISGSESFSILEAVHTAADYWGFDKSVITPILAEQIGQAANRPRKTGFILDKAKRELGFQPTPFLEALAQIDKQINILWHR